MIFCWEEALADVETLSRLEHASPYRNLAAAKAEYAEIQKLYSGRLELKNSVIEDRDRDIAKLKREGHRISNA